MKRIFLVAGESSGDTHGANLVRALRESDPEIHFEGLGGQMMAAEGMTLRHDLAGEAIMGFAEVVKHFLPIRRLFLDTVAHLEATRPDCLVLIDYPGFNIRLAKEAQRLGIPVVYYISPQVWAWKKKRVHTLARCVRKMLVIFPFEEAIYRAVGMDCTYVGHPLLDHAAGFEPEGPAEACLVGVLPGSREQEIARLLPSMIEVARGIRERYPEARFAAPAVNEDRAAQVQALAGGFPLDIAVGGMYEVLSRARFCLVASGTATLETALFGVPMVILYRVNPVSYRLARWLVDVEHIGMVNILAGRRIVPEYVQHEVRPETILSEALELMEDGPMRECMLADLGAVRENMGGGGASRRAAAEILTLLEGEKHE